MSKIGNHLRLTLAGIAAAAPGLASSLGIAAATPPGMLVLGVAAVVGVAGNYFLSRRASRAETEADAGEKRALAERNHHLRRGMAQALRTALTEVKGGPEALIGHWVDLLEKAESDDAVLDRVFPEVYSESQWEAGREYNVDKEVDAHSLAVLLREWLTVDPAMHAEWGAEAARDFARRLLPLYQRAFAEAVTGDRDGFLARAFNLKALQENKDLILEFAAENRDSHLKTQEMIRALDSRLGAQARPEEQREFCGLPLKTGFFVGRDEFLRSVREAMQSDRRVLVSANGGYGKTQAALEYVTRHRSEYSHVVWFNCSTSGTLFDSSRRVVGHFGLPLPSESNEQMLQDAVKGWLARHPGALAVFDNLDDPEVVKPYWPVSPECAHLLVTSRKSKLDALDRLTGLELREWEAPEALEFLEKRTGRAGLAGAEREAAEWLARETGFLPLALEQAAAYIRHTGCSFEDYQRTFERARLALLEKRPAGLAGVYAFSVATTWQASMNRLSAPARALLEALSLLSPDGTPLELILCAPEALGDPLAGALTDPAEVAPLATVLGDLLDYSLVKVDRVAGLISVHRLLHEVVREGQSAEEREEWIGRWIRVFGEFLPEDAGHFESVPHSRGWSAFLALFLRVGKEHPEVEAAATIGNGFVVHFEHRGRWVDAEPVARHVVALFESSLGREHPVTLRTVVNLAGICQWQGQFGEAEPLLLRALDGFERVLGAENPDTLTTVNNLAELYRTQGRYGESEALHLQALEGWERRLGAEHPHTLTTLSNLALLRTSQGQYEIAGLLHSRVLQVRERQLGSEHPHSLSAVNNLACLYERQGRYGDAEPLYLRALEARVRVLGAEHPDTLRSVLSLAGLYESQGLFGKAGPLYTRALETQERVMGKEHPETLTTVNNLALLYMRQGHYGKAEALYLRAIEAGERVLGAEHPDTLRSANNLGGVYESQGRLEEAELMYLRALEGWSRVLGEYHPDTLSSVNNLAGLYQLQRRFAEAEPLCLRALIGGENVLGAEHPDTLRAVNNLAVLYLRKGRPEDAEVLLSRALQTKLRLLGADHPDTLTSMNNLAQLYESQGRVEKAEPLYGQAIEGAEEVLGAEHPSTLTSVNNLGVLRCRQGRFAEAEGLLVRAVAGRRAVLGAEHPDTLSSEKSLAKLRREMGGGTGI